ANLLSHIRFQVLLDLRERIDTGTFLLPAAHGPQVTVEYSYAQIHDVPIKKPVGYAFMHIDVRPGDSSPFFPR
ncbi:hypothetical protein, partial [Burkholderia contaminans]|uniref:hypothetical protein n=1 Tax=Burkholderia contaminans TaxID=488447 RepID=UPI001C2E3F92